jgi:Zn-dependent M28 family amino/carboxypeptidase
VAKSYLKSDLAGVFLLVLAGILLYLDPPRVAYPPKPAPYPEPVVTPPGQYDTLEQALAQLDKRDLQAHISTLASAEFEGRGNGMPGLSRARAYIERQLEDWGLKTYRDAFGVGRGNGVAENVYVAFEGTRPDEVVVVGAHYDHVGTKEDVIYPGADDNASGVAAVLEIAHTLARLKQKPQRTIVCQFYAGEELGYLGSTHYCTNPKWPIAKPDIKAHVYMVNLDMIGRAGTAGDPGLNTGSTRLTGAIGAAPDLVGKPAPVTPKAKANAGGSDHVSFQRSGVPTKFYHTGIHADWHKPTDTADKINSAGVLKTTKDAARDVWQQSCSPTRLPTTGFAAPLPLTDHAGQSFGKE